MNNLFEYVLHFFGDFFQVPWSMLKGACVPEDFCERHSIVLAPSLTSTRFKPKGLNKSSEEEDNLSSFVVGNPKLPSSIIGKLNF